MIKDKEASSVTIGTTVLIFSLITFFYYVIRYNLYNYSKDKQEEDSSDNVYFSIYLLIVILTNFFINLNISNEVCGTNQWQTAIFATLGSWLIIFGFIFIGLKSYPSWLMPFSNTFGYGVAYLANLDETVNSLFKSTDDSSIKNDKGSLNMLEKIFSQKSLVVNEITMNNFNNFWDKMKGLFISDANKLKELKISLKQIIHLKELTAEFLWYILAGFLIISVSKNYIVTTSCKRSVQELKNRYNNVLNNKENKENK